MDKRVKMKCAYATILSSEDFTEGVKRLYSGIRRFSHREVIVFVNEEISNYTVDELEKLGLTVIRETTPVFDEGIISEKQATDRWNKTLFKFVIFKEHGFDKLIYLDCDLLVRANLDDLFDKPEWSAVPDRDFYPESGREGLNAGVMVINPSEKIFHELISKVSEVADKQRIFGDQDVINSFLSNWDEEEHLHLSNDYNSCFYSDRVSITPKVVHFIFASKPWMWSNMKRLCKIISWFVRGKRERTKYLSEYFRS